MLKKRVIPVLLLQQGGLVKGERFKNHKYVGDPINAVRIFNEKEVDELCFVDISVGIEDREPDYNLIEDMASEAFMPIAYGGGIRRTDHVEKLFKLGVEKIIINSAFYENPELVRECSKIAGSQSIVVALDVRTSLFGKQEVYVRNGSKKTGMSPVEYAKKAESFGAGEILLTSIDREGKGQGIDIELTRRVVDAVDIPVITQGGIGSLEDIRKAIEYSRVSAFAAGSFFTFHGKHKAVLLTYPSYNELENLFLN